MKIRDLNWQIKLLEFNAVNQDDITKYLSQFQSEIPQVKSWLSKNIKNYIINSEELNKIVKLKAKAGDPEWLKTAIARGDQLYKFSPNSQFTDKLHHILDWLDSEQATPYLPKLFKVTFDQADKLAENWTKSLIKKASSKEDEAGIENVLDFPNGYRIVKLLSPQSLDREGKLMGHCVGSYARRVGSGKTTIFSLRDQKNEPHATIEVTTGEIKQIKGKENKPVITTYIPYITAFITKSGLEVIDSELKNINLIKINKKIYDINNLPNNLKVGRDLDLSNTQISSLPDNLKVGRDLDLRNTQISSLPDNLQVAGSLDLRDTQISSLPDNLRVGTDLWLRNTQISSLPDNLKVGGSLDLRNTQISSLPDNLQVAGWLNLENTQISSLPDNLKVAGYLNLENTQISSLPDNLKVAGSLNLRNTKIPKNYPIPKGVKGKVYW